MSPTATLPDRETPSVRLQLIRGLAPPRVLHVVPSLHGGGMERALVGLMEGFDHRGQRQEQPDLEHGVCVLGGGDADLLERCRSSAATFVLSAPGDRPTRRRARRQLREVIASFEPDVVHARTTAVWFDAAWVTYRDPRTRLVLSFHGRTHLGQPGRLRRWIHRWACGRADAVLSVSHDAGRMLHAEWGIPRRKIHVIHNGVDTERFTPVGPADKTGLHLPPRSPSDHVVICVANLHEIKAIDVLLDHWRRVVMADPHAVLWLVGEGPLHESLVRQAGRLRIAERVRFLGRRDDVPALLRAADLFVLPSRYEAGSNATLEAMASGLPVVAFDVGGMRELIQPNHTGWLIPENEPHRLADTVLAALIDRATRQRTGQAARRAVLEQHDMNHWIDRYATLYRHLAERGTPACAE
ncbi:MAG TPA: glycosyltransferase family 4 protein [Phycisphaerae bacterium]|nr:glycosyltransferase family 4 protein [Phycisphaerae bacterium]